MGLPTVSQMRNYCQLKRNTPVQNADNGELADSWKTYANCWACFESASGSLMAVQQASTLVPTAQYRVTTRHVCGIALTDLLVWGDRNFTINSVDDPNGTQQFTVLVVTEILR